MSKGGSGERKIAKQLNKWLGAPKDELWIWRSPGSGAVATINKKKDITGDLVSFSPEANWIVEKFSIEVKTGYKKASFDKHLKENKNDEFYDFWEQSVRDASKGNKEPILIFNKDRFPVIIGITTKLYNNICKNCNDFNKISRISMKFNDDILPEVNFIDFELFLKLITPDILRNS